MNHLYGDEFYANHAGGSLRSALVVLDRFFKIIQVKSVIDIGCGIGTWLNAARQVAPCVEIFGVDQPHGKTTLQIDRDVFQAVDFNQAFYLGKRFDLALCLEVAEHLDESVADTFVKSLCDHSDTILFSAAIPGQGGVHHVNEQWPSYWVQKFEKEGYKVFDVIRPHIWKDSRVEVWYRQNILVFSKAPHHINLLSSVDACLPVDLAHPELFSDVNRERQSLVSKAGYVRLTRSLVRRVASKLVGIINGSGRDRSP